MKCARMKPSQVTVIYHRADYDGIFCREIARKFFGESARYIGWDFGDTPLSADLFRESPKVYVMDLPADRVFGFDWNGPDDRNSRAVAMAAGFEQLIWIDHHKSSIDSLPKEMIGYRIDGVAACRLAWQWFFNPMGPMNPNLQEPDYHLPTDVQFKNREVSEPLAVRLAGEYDIWDHRDNDADVAFQFGLDSQVELSWGDLLALESDGDKHREYISHVISDGRAAMRCYARRDADVMNHRSFLADFEGLRFLVLNTPRCNSNTFKSKDVPETGHDALMAFYCTGRDWSVSMYHAAHRKDLDLSEIAKKHGGGGHRGACGFLSHRLPFVTDLQC